MTLQRLTVPWFAGLALLTCSAPRQEAPSAPPPASVPVARPVHTAKAQVAGAVTHAAEAPFELEAFTPLLALPELAAVARLVEEGEPAQAAVRLEAQLASGLPASVAVVEARFLLARIFEQSEDWPSAARQYELAAVQPWLLADDARVAAGRCRLRAGQAALADTMLASVRAEAPLAPAAELLRVQAALAGGLVEAALNLWRGLERHSPEPNGAAATALDLAEAIASCPPSTDAGGARGAALRSKDGCASISPQVALELVRRVRLGSDASTHELVRARHLEEDILAALGAAARQALAPITIEERLVELGKLGERARWKEAGEAIEELRACHDYPMAPLALRCQTDYWAAKVRASNRDWSGAAEVLVRALKRCQGDPDWRARARYLAGKYSSAAGRKLEAIRHFAELEREVPTHRLADDARLLGAGLWLDRGVEARFTQMLSTIAEDYPDGDMVLDGVFKLALRRIEKSDWSGAAAVLERAAELAQSRELGRGQEFSGRERYFLARARIVLGETEKGLRGYEEIVQQLPLSYYAIEAHTRLHHADPGRAARVIDEALERTHRAPFAFEKRPEFETPEFQRAMALLRVGESEQARETLRHVGLDVGGEARNALPALLWGIALLYERAGISSLGHRIARGMLTDWLTHWPVGDWTRAWEIAYPRPYHGLVADRARVHGVPEYLAYAVMREESAFEAGVVSHAQAYGLMQIIVPTARGYARPLGLPYSPAALKRPSVNITLGCRILGDLSQRFSYNPLLAIPGYNAGPGRPKRWVKERPDLDFDVWVELIPFRETRRYTKRVLSSRAAYAFLYYSGEAQQALLLPVKVKP